MANTTSNLTHIESNWLIRQQPGMNRQSHTRIYYMLLAYNGVSVFFAIALATPYFFGLSVTAKKKSLQALPFDVAEIALVSPERRPQKGLYVSLNYFGVSRPFYLRLTSSRTSGSVPDGNIAVDTASPTPQSMGLNSTVVDPA